MSFRGQVRAVNVTGPQNTMWGLKNTNTNYSYTQMPHAIYFNNGAIQIYENGAYRGNVGTYTTGTLYDVRIDLKSSGATYYIKEAGAGTWTILREATSPATSPLRMGATVHSGTFEFDNFSGAGPAEAYVATLTVIDGAGQRDRDTATVQIQSNHPPRSLPSRGSARM